MKLFYWSPFLSNIATIDAVINSINSLKRYGEKNKYKTYLIDASGEWQEKSDKTSACANSSSAKSSRPWVL